FTAQDASGKVLLWIRSLGSLSAQSLPNTNGAALPFWSPDSRWVGFYAQGKLKKIDITAGSPQIVCDAPNSRGGTWNRDGLIVFTPSNPGPLSSVSAAGDQLAAITKILPSETTHPFPDFPPV